MTSSQNPCQKVSAWIFNWSSKHWLLLSDYLSKYLSLRETKILRTPIVIAFLSDIFAMEETPAEVFTNNGL